MSRLRDTHTNLSEDCYAEVTVRTYASWQENAAARLNYREKFRNKYPRH